ncbi:MAG: chromosome segregation protein SMC [Gammaproteobacteria bacterium]|nr:chromosome segregation protein SMC [Gammaproteobacteria bacterium]
MKLTKIKLTGFKSFADPTAIEIAGDMTGVVGPNGCGKSNIVDAVRWVMGHTARNIRAANLQDVIFSGTRSRKPVGQASVELIFDNADGSFGGQYAAYGEISVKRIADRSQESKYFINNTRCRRRDVSDLFFGTGLGGQSYALVQQGMIARIIEARPEEMRLYLEEAAGISKYHERKRDTEVRMRHTRDNLDRVLDHREEVAKQVEKLKRQARGAERFSELKRLKEQLEARVALLEFRRHDSERAACDRRVSGLRLELDANQADLRGVEARTGEQRAAHDGQNQALNDAREKFYRLNADISGIEQDIAHRRKNAEQIRREESAVALAMDKCRDRIGEQESRLAADNARLDESQSAAAAARDEVARLEAALQQAEQQLAQAGREWERHHSDGRQSLEAAEVGRVKLEYCDRELEDIAHAAHEVAGRRAALDLPALEAQCSESAQLQARREREAADCGREYDRLAAAVAAVRDQLHQQQGLLHEEQVGLQDMRGRLASLEALQQAGLGRDRQAFTEWRQRHGLDDAAQMVAKIEVNDGWESAVELVLEAFLEGVEVASLDDHAGHAGQIDSGRLVMFERGSQENRADKPSLADQVRADAGVLALLRCVYPADDLAQALARRSQLADHESFITRDGVWVGRHWMQLRKDADEQGGVLVRRKTMEQLTADIEVAGRKAAELRQELDSVRRKLAQDETQLEEVQGRRAGLLERATDAGGDLHRRKAKLRHGQELLAELEQQEQRLSQRREAAQTQRRELLKAHEEALASTSDYDSGRADLQRRRADGEQQVADARAGLHDARQRLHELEVGRQSLAAGLEGVVENIAQTRQQYAELEQRAASMKRVAADSQHPIQERQDELQGLVNERALCEQAVRAGNEELEAVQAKIRELENRHKELEAAREALQQRHEQARMEEQASRIRCEDWQKKIGECRWTREQIESELDPAATLESCREELEAVERRIHRLGAINLAAAEEYREESERKEYLDSQCEDLTTALETLDAAIARIDRVSREKFKSTFENINNRLEDVFSRLFGGGQAYLQLNENDWLKGGVSIMVRPPGKRLSSINLLSGGEKALAAMAVVFSIFELRPAPFCVLDEVDAPLDETNVLRFCELLKDMKDRVQFIVITHNRLTMENMACLVGVTMGEPGVSRLVSVNIEEAAQMAG